MFLGGKLVVVVIERERERETKLREIVSSLGKRGKILLIVTIKLFFAVKIAL